jgi:hypothetical protein
MTKKPLIAALIATAATFALVAPWSRAQTIGSHASTSLVRTWPPHPASMFHWMPTNITSLSPGQAMSVAVVPSDRWLVLNNCYWIGGSDLVIAERGPGGDTTRVTYRGGELIGDNTTVGPMGFAFAPGTEVILKYLGSSPNSQNLKYFNLMGYFTRP